MLRRFWDSDSGACSYLLASDLLRQAMLIDPVFRHIPLYLGVLDELDYSLSLVLETHLHADHLSGAAMLREMTGCQIACGRLSGIEGADILLDDGACVGEADLSLNAMATPGHSLGCLTYRWKDYLFTGDCLLIGGCGRTDEPEGRPGRLFDSLFSRLLTLPDELIVLPGHGTQNRWVSCIGEEKRTNAMLQGVSRDEFIAACRRRQMPPAVSPEQNLDANRRCAPSATGLL